MQISKVFSLVTGLSNAMISTPLARSMHLLNFARDRCNRRSNEGVSGDSKKSLNSHSTTDTKQKEFKKEKYDRYNSF